MPVDSEARRREWTLALTRVTHTGPEAVAAACVMSACASWAVEGAPTDVLVEVACEEAGTVGADTKVVPALEAVRAGSWEPPGEGISLSPDETVAAVLHCCRTTDG